MAEEQKKAAQRPDSTIVQSFSADLDSMFGLSSSGGVGSLEQTVEEKKQNVSSASEKLQELEAKLRETEQRLAKVSRQNSPSRQATTGVSSSNPDQQQATSGATSTGKSPLAQKPTYPDDRPPTGGRPHNTREDTQAMMSRMPGGMPETPKQYNGSNEYVMVDRGDEG